MLSSRKTLLLPLPRFVPLSFFSSSFPFPLPPLPSLFSFPFPFFPPPPKVVQRTDSKDGSTTKLLIQLQDGHKFFFLYLFLFLFLFLFFSFSFSSSPLLSPLFFPFLSSLSFLFLFFFFFFFRIETVIMRYGVTCLTNFPDEIQVRKKKGKEERERRKGKKKGKEERERRKKGGRKEERKGGVHFIL